MSAEQKEQLSDNSLLSRDAILRHIEAGNITIDPFDARNLKTASYDVSLGKHFYREQDLGPLKTMYSPYSYDDVHEIWGKPQVATLASDLFLSQGLPIPKGIHEDDKVIVIGPGETILANTEEFIGGKFCTMATMHARSSGGRNFIEVCKCAGWGDVGYINRWTMEITNISRRYAIPLVVGRRYAQLAFHQVDPIIDEEYGANGKYQKGENIETIKQKWLPHHMLPRMWEDREVEK